MNLWRTRPPASARRGPLSCSLLSNAPAGHTFLNLVEGCLFANIFQGLLKRRFRAFFSFNRLLFFPVFFRPSTRLSSLDGSCLFCFSVFRETSPFSALSIFLLSGFVLSEISLPLELSLGLAFSMVGGSGRSEQEFLEVPDRRCRRFSVSRGRERPKRYR